MASKHSTAQEIIGFVNAVERAMKAGDMNAVMEWVTIAQAFLRRTAEITKNWLLIFKEPYKAQRAALLAYTAKWLKP